MHTTCNAQLRRLTVHSSTPRASSVPQPEAVANSKSPQSGPDQPEDSLDCCSWLPGEFDLHLSEYMVVLDKPIGLTLAPDPAMGQQIVVQAIKAGSPAAMCQLIEVGDVLTFCSAVSGEGMWPATDLRRVHWAIHNRVGKVKLILDRHVPAPGREAQRTWYKNGAAGVASCMREPLQLPIALVSTTLEDVGPDRETAAAPRAGRSMAVAFHRSTGDPAQVRYGRAAAVRSSRLQSLRDGLAVARCEPELDVQGGTIPRLDGTEGSLGRGASRRLPPGAAAASSSLYRPTITQAARSKHRTDVAAQGWPMSLLLQPKAPSLSSSTGGTVPPGMSSGRDEYMLSFVPTQLSRDQYNGGGGSSSNRGEGGSYLNGGALSSGSSSSKQLGEDQGIKVTPLLPWLLVSSRLLDARGIMQVASHRGLASLLELSLSTSSGYLAVHGSINTFEARAATDYRRGIYHVTNAVPFKAADLQQDGAASADGSAAQEPAVVAPSDALPSGAPGDPTDGGAPWGLGRLRGIGGLGDSEAEGSSAGQSTSASASATAEATGGTLSGTGETAADDPSGGLSTSSSGLQQGSGFSEANSSALRSAGDASFSGRGQPPPQMQTKQPPPAPPLTTYPSGLARTVERQQRINALLDAAAALQRLSYRRQVSSSRYSSPNACSVLLQCEDAGMESEVAGLLSGWLHWYGHLPLQEAILSAELAINAPVDQDLLEDATEALTESGSERMSRATVVWTHGGLSASVAGDLVGSWTNLVALAQCTDTRYCKGGVSMGHFFLELAGLAPGTYVYKFIVDGTWTVDPDRPKVLDEAGNWNNVVEVLQPPPVVTTRERLALARWQAARLAHETKLGLPALASDRLAPHRRDYVNHGPVDYS